MYSLFTEMFLLSVNSWFIGGYQNLCFNFEQQKNERGKEYRHFKLVRDNDFQQLENVIGGFLDAIELFRIPTGLQLVLSTVLRLFSVVSLILYTPRCTWFDVRLYRIL